MGDVTFKFEGKRAVVTGAGRGIGRAIAKALSISGAETYAISKTEQNLKTLTEECPAIRPVCVDLCDWNATQSAVDAIGPVDMLVNNAGVSSVQSFMDVTPDVVSRIFDVNVKAVIAVSQAVARNMVKHSVRGSIVNMSSQASMRALDNHTVYCASKGALDQLTRVMALELGPKQIRVNSVNPTVVWTDMAREFWSDPARSGPMKARIPLGKFAEESDVVSAVLYLLSDSAAMCNGTFLSVDGGFTV